MAQRPPELKEDCGPLRLAQERVAHRDAGHTGHHRVLEQRAVPPVAEDPRHGDVRLGFQMLQEKYLLCQTRARAQLLRALDFENEIGVNSVGTSFATSLINPCHRLSRGHVAPYQGQHQIF